MQLKPTGKRLRRRPLADRFWEKVDRRGPDECWYWTGANSKGYGNFYIETVDGAVRNKGAHVVAYELLVGPVPEGLDLDHLCRNPSCVNPAHLEPVTHLENMRRGKVATKTHCVHGHEFTPENTMDNAGYRCCRTCWAANKRARYHRDKTSGVVRIERECVGCGGVTRVRVPVGATEDQVAAAFTAAGRSGGLCWDCAHRRKAA